VALSLLLNQRSTNHDMVIHKIAEIASYQRYGRCEEQATEQCARSKPRSNVRTLAVVILITGNPPGRITLGSARLHHCLLALRFKVTVVRIRDVIAIFIR